MAFTFTISVCNSMSDTTERIKECWNCAFVITPFFIVFTIVLLVVFLDIVNDERRNVCESTKLEILYKSKTQCPKGWINAGKYGCFHIARESEHFNWQDAEDYCQSLYKDAHLAEIWNFEVSLLLQCQHELYSVCCWWFGGRDLKKVSTEYTKISRMLMENHGDFCLLTMTAFLI